MYSVLTIAEAIIEHEHSLGRECSNLRLQKLLYFAQAKFLTETKLPCFEDRIEAADFGPIVPVVFDRYKIFGSWDITRTLGVTIDVREKDLKRLYNILDYCKDYPTYQLTDISCKQSPWNNARMSGFKHVPITNYDIQTYFEKGFKLDEKRRTKKVKVTKEIERLLEKRQKVAEELMSLDYRVQEWCDKKGIALGELINEHACMLYTEPFSYREMTLKKIQES